MKRAMDSAHGSSGCGKPRPPRRCARRARISPRQLAANRRPPPKTLVSDATRPPRAKSSKITVLGGLGLVLILTGHRRLAGHTQPADAGSAGYDNDFRWKPRWPRATGGRGQTRAACSPPDESALLVMRKGPERHAGRTSCENRILRLRKNDSISFSRIIRLRTEVRGAALP